MSRSLIFAGVLAAGALAKSAPCSDLSSYEHLGCVVAKTNSFPRHYPGLSHTGCSSTCSTNGNIVALGDGCSCDRLDLSDRPVPYHVTKVDDSLCSSWCDPADQSKGTCGGGIYQGYQVFDLYKRSNAIVIFEPMPATHVVVPGAPVQSPGPAIPDSGRRPGDVFHDCPPDVIDCPYRKTEVQKCTTGNCNQVHPAPEPVPVPVPEVCHGCNYTQTNWTRPAEHPVNGTPCNGDHCVPDGYYDQNDNGCTANENDGDSCPVYHPGGNKGGDNGGEGTRPVEPVKPVKPAKPVEPVEPVKPIKPTDNDETTGPKGNSPACVGDHCYVVNKPAETPVIANGGAKAQTFSAVAAISAVVLGFSFL